MAIGSWCGPNEAVCDCRTAAAGLRPARASRPPGLCVSALILRVIPGTPGTPGTSSTLRRYDNVEIALDDAFVLKVEQEFHAPANAELLVGVVQMNLHRAFGDAQLLRDATILGATRH